MTTEKTKLAVHTIVKEYDEDAILEMIQEQKHEYIDQDDLDAFDGDFDQAYDETGHGAAESDIMNQVVKDCGIELDFDEFCEVYETLCEIWGISTD